MSLYKVVSLNYISSGKNKTFFNVDISSDYILENTVYVLNALSSMTAERQKVLLEQKSGHEVSVNFIAKDGFDKIYKISSDIIVLENKEKDILSGISLSSEQDIPYNTQRMMADNTTYYLCVDTNNHPIALETSISDILLTETQPYVEDILSIRYAFKIYTEKDLDSFKEKVYNYINSLSGLSNKTYVYERIQNSSDVANLNIRKKERETTYPLYDIIDVTLKSQNKQNCTNVPLYDGKENIFIPQMINNPKQFCQYNGYTYVLGWNTKDDVIYYNSSLLSTRETNYNINKYNMYLGERNNEIGLYSSPSVIVADKDNPDFSISKIIQKTYHSFLAKIDNEEDYDYYKGNEYCDIFETKSFYDAQYNMSVSMLEDDITLKQYKCREYIGLGTYGDNLYLKYYDNKDYETVIDNGIGIAQNISKNKYPYQKIETLAENRTNIVKNHKSNMFSVRLNNTIFGDEDEYEETKTIKYKQIKKDIINAIRDIVDNNSPINTSLIDVQFRI